MVLEDRFSKILGSEGSKEELSGFRLETENTPEDSYSMM